jgi:hypothetical protein
MPKQKAKGKGKEFDFLLEEGKKLGALEAKIIGMKGEGPYVIHD